ncbi:MULTISPECIES: glycosyltransferase [Bacteroides]|jgi:hypothetical protein|uniref:Glycosyltransferase family 1 protein n=1 Tax=Bacteroides intestinalis TaxID=329854 RepID=A0A139L3G8_9BACE|nr:MULTISPECIES: glycosyltransferase [Bacteroides]KXT45981.1 hypothetical protein HMPREF2531_03301 [Bacteroides intestinalis]
MKVLIIGEYSGFAKNLSDGFSKLGHVAVVFSSGDGWKNIPLGTNDRHLPQLKNFSLFGITLKKSWMLRGIWDSYYFHKGLCKCRDFFDVAIIIHYEFIRLEREFWRPTFSLKDIKFLLSNKGQIYLSACGDDFPYLTYFPKFRYHPPINLKSNPFLHGRLVSVFNKVLYSAKGVIPVMYDYAVAYRDMFSDSDINVYPTIPLPINLDKYSEENRIGRKIVIFHGINRPEKGTDIILRALNRIGETYPEKVEIIVEGKMEFEKYVCVLRKSNIVVDQCWGYGYGINAIISMAMGKIVLSGNEPENREGFDQVAPVVNILPNEEHIFDTLSKLINNVEQLKIISSNSRAFVEKNHADVLVAKKYMSLFCKYIK